MLKILKNGQADLIDAMQRDSTLLVQAQKLIKTYSLDEMTNNILFILLQQEIFGNQYERISDEELSKVINTTRYKLDQGMRRLIKMNLVKQVGKSPKIHVISDSLKEKLAKK